MTAPRRRPPKAAVAGPDGRDGHDRPDERRDGDATKDPDGNDGRAGAVAPAQSTAPVAPERSAAPERTIDPRAVRVGLAATMGHVEMPQLVVEPPPTPVAPTPRVLGVGILGGVAERPKGPPVDGSPDTGPVLVDGEPSGATLVHLDPTRAILRTGDGHADPIRVLLEPADVSTDGRGVSRREVVVDGWRIEVEVESERRAALRDRARRGREESAHGGPTEVHAIIPGRIVSVSIAPGDEVVASQQLLVVEAMKMQNELHAPRDGTVTKVGVAPGDTIEIGDLLLVLE